MNYRFFVPKGYDSRNEYPLNGFIHRVGEIKQNNTAQVGVGCNFGLMILSNPIILALLLRIKVMEIMVTGQMQIGGKETICRIRSQSQKAFRIT